MTADDFIEAPKDQWGRYKINTPAGKSLGYTRVTTISKTTDETSALANWKTRMAITGLIKRPDLLAQASTSLDDKYALNRIAVDAVEAAGGSTRANLGTALHSLTQQIDLCLKPTILPGLKADIDAYTQGMIHEAFSMTSDMIEVLLINDTLQYAGTADRIITLPDGRQVIFDLKTGSNIQYSHGNIAVQLAAYANAEWLYDWRTGERTPLPDIDKTVGVICHLPAGEGRCEFYQVDLVAGLEALQLSLKVREWRKHKNLFTTYGAVPVVAEQPKKRAASKKKMDKQTDKTLVNPTDTPPNVDTAIVTIPMDSLNVGDKVTVTKAIKKAKTDKAKVIKKAEFISVSLVNEPIVPALTIKEAPTFGQLDRRREWLRNRIGALTPAAQIMLKHSWPADIPRLTDCDNEQITLLIRAIELIEAHHTTPFYPPDPTTIKPATQLTTFKGDTK